MSRFGDLFADPRAVSDSSADASNSGSNGNSKDSVWSRVDFKNIPSTTGPSSLHASSSSDEDADNENESSYSEDDDTLIRQRRYMETELAMQEPCTLAEPRTDVETHDTWWNKDTAWDLNPTLPPVPPISSHQYPFTAALFSAPLPNTLTSVTTQSRREGGIPSQTNGWLEPAIAPSISRPVTAVTRPRTGVRRLAEMFMGYGAFGDRTATVSLPLGWSVQHTRIGTAYVAPSTEHDKEAHRPNLPMNCTLQDIEQAYGMGIFLYFDFIIFLCKTNLVLFALALINFIPHLLVDQKTVGFLFLSDYSVRIRPYWMASTVLSILLWFLFSPIYSNHVTRIFKARGEEDTENHYGSENDIIPRNRKYPRKLHVMRLFISYALFLCLLVLCGVASKLLIAMQNTVTCSNSVQRSLLNRFIASVLIALFIRGVNVMWKRIGFKLTEFERHRTWTSSRKHAVLKLYLFKILNVLVMFWSQTDGNTKFGKCDRSDDNACVLGDLGLQFVVQLVVEVTLGNLWDIVFDKLVYAIGRIRAQGEKGSEEEKEERSRPDFEIAEEYLELLYRQFITYLGMSIVPILPLLALIANLSSYRCDRYRLFRVCKTPPRLTGSMRRVIVFFMFLTASASLTSWPLGAAFMLSGINSSDIGTCDILIQH